MSKSSQLAVEIRRTETTSTPVITKLRTDERVLARITDGIYRQPASAIRELISNAYDADAKNVWINTDSPRFDTITVEDDGNGFTPESLANLVHHIGGSPKRTEKGAVLGVTSNNDETLSPNGRKLIGKIGIGLFAVAQLTRHFQIITKCKDDAYRSIADVTLKSYSEGTDEIDSGEVRIWREKASDRATHGTEIILLQVKDYTKQILQTRDRWERTEDKGDGSAAELLIGPPDYHIGSVDRQHNSLRNDDANLPWKKNDKPRKRFENLYQAILDEVGTTTANPSLEKSFDNYLQMIWNLALSAPVKYVDQHPFKLTGGENIKFFAISNEAKGRPEEIAPSPRQTIGDRLKLEEPDKSNSDFQVFIDDIELLRPIRFRDLPQKSAAALTTPLLFVGKCTPDLASISADISGGNELSFEGYFLWSPKVVPKENNGIIVRIANAAGTLFDDTFMHYEVSEHNRLKQITAEIFVHNGIDAALNIDRESFNYAHPHYQFLSRWVHRALRQLTNKHKELGRIELEKRKRKSQFAQIRKIDRIVQQAVKLIRDQDSEDVADVEFVTEIEAASIPAKRKQGGIVLSLSDVFGPESSGLNLQARNLLEHRMAAVAQVLEAYGLLQQLDYPEQNSLLRAICDLFLAGDDQ